MRDRGPCERARKRAEEKEKAKEDANVDIEMTNVLSVSAAPSKVTAKGKGKQRASATADLEDGGDESDANSELDEQEKVMEWGKGGKGRGMKAFQQRDLVARAFAGDNVVQVGLPREMLWPRSDCSRRTLRRPNDERFKKTRQKKSTPHSQAG